MTGLYVASGTEANTGGRILERHIETALKAYGFETFDYSDSADNLDMFAARRLVRNVPYFPNIFGGMSRSEFVIEDDHQRRRIRVECRWQQSGGSTDEKLVALLLNAAEAMPENEVIIVVDGNGAREACVDWIKNAAISRKYQTRPKTIRVMSMAEFSMWAREFARGRAS